MKSNWSLIRRNYGNSIIGHNRIKIFLSIAIVWMALGCISWMSSRTISEVLLPPSAPGKDLSHLRRNRNLRHYLDNIQLLIEPSAVPCSNLEEVKVLVLVASTPSRLDYRQAIRLTWGPLLPTYFILGLDSTINDDLLINNYVEAKQYSDMVVFDFKDHYQNLTLKTSLMLQWSSKRCPQAQFVYKNDDDTMVNPWVLEKVLKERGDAKILGYIKNNSIVHRDEHSKWFLPRWLYPEDVIPQYATGPGYLINAGSGPTSFNSIRLSFSRGGQQDIASAAAACRAGSKKRDQISKVLAAATTVPLHNMEDVYFTYNVGKKKLNFELTHDERLSPYRPIIPLSCSYWRYASIHSLKPGEIVRIWTYIRRIGEQFSDGVKVCEFYRKYLNSFVTYTW